MAIPKLACDRERLRQSLDDRLSEQHEEVLMQHLAECPACQQELERLAAEQTEWSRVAEMLRREAAARISSAGAAGTREPACDSPVDFAVAFLEPSSLPGALGRLGEIDILEVIGHGGMGIVLKGFQEELHRPVAVKVLAPHLAASGAARQRFAREARATAVVVHPNVMPVLTVHSSGKLPYLVMPYVPCESLQQRLDRQGWLETLDVVRIAWQVACGLAAAHAQGLVHRDIKPANMLLEKGVDRVLLTDFGLARAVDDASLTRTGVIAGTPQYMSPEQACGEAVDHRSDLFSLGSVLYAMCTGRVPFRAETSYGILRRITDTEPRPIREINPGIPKWLVTIVAKLHAKDPAGRFASADELAKLLEQCLAHVQQPTAVPLPEAVAATELASVEPRLTATTASLFSSRFHRPLLIGSFFAGLLALAAVAGIAIRIPQHAGDERSKSPAESAASAAPSVTGNAARGQTTMFVWQDGAVEQIRDLDEATDQFETSAQQLWDHQTSSARSNYPTNAIQPSNQQVTK